VIRTVVRISALVLALLLAYLAFSFVQVWQASRRDQARDVEAIVVFGAAQYNGRPSRVLRARLDHTAALYRKGLSDVVVVTGGSQPGDAATEASTSAVYLKQKGVPESALLREVRGRNSWESLAAAANFLRQRGRNRVLLVSDPFHSARVAAMADELGLDAYVSPTRTSPIGGAEEIRHVGREAVAMAAGRVVGFRRLMGIRTEVTRVRDSA
jgi:uncharacterized SAM-binding protein YcdF (DUF218 family)